MLFIFIKALSFESAGLFEDNLAARLEKMISYVSPLRSHHGGIQHRACDFGRIHYKCTLSLAYACIGMHPSYGTLGINGQV